MLWGVRREHGMLGTVTNRWRVSMPKPNDLSRSITAFEQNSTLIAVIEISLSSWLMTRWSRGSSGIH